MAHRMDCQDSRYRGVGTDNLYVAIHPTPTSIPSNYIPETVTFPTPSLNHASRQTYAMCIGAGFVNTISSKSQQNRPPTDGIEPADQSHSAIGCQWHNALVMNSRTRILPFTV